ANKYQPKWRLLAAGGTMAILAAVGAAVVPWLRSQDTPCVTRTLPPMKEGPSIAVLPLDNLSGDPEQTPIVDGIADDLTSALWQIHDLFVIARNSSFAYRGKSCDIRRVARELGVHNLIEGSVQRSGDTMRIDIQIIDGTSGGHIWAKTFDGSFSDHLALQDRGTQSIADALSLRLDLFSGQASVRGENRLPGPYQAFLRGQENLRRLTKRDLAEAVFNFEEAVSLDQNYSRAYAALAMTYIRSATRRWSTILGISSDDAVARAKKYLALANEHPTTLS